MESTASQPKTNVAANQASSSIPPEKKALIVDFIMGIRTVLSDPDEGRARLAATHLVDKAIAELDKDEQGG